MQVVERSGAGRAEEVTKHERRGSKEARRPTAAKLPIEYSVSIVSSIFVDVITTIVDLRHFVVSSMKHLVSGMLGP